MLVAHIIHSEEQGRYQCDDHHGHGTFRVDAVVNVYARPGGCVGDKQERFESVEYGLKHRQFASFLKSRFNLVEIIP